MSKEDRKCLKIALTGGMGCGKSAAAAAFANLGAETIDADKLGHIALERDPDTKRAIIALLGEKSYFPDGSPNRAEIARQVFADAQKLKALEEITHPAIEKMWLQRAQEIEKLYADEKCDLPVLIVEVPLLFEKKLETKFDICISVYCSDALRRQRLSERGMNAKEISERDAFQIPPIKKAALSDIVLFNESSLEFLQRQAALVLSRLI